MPWMSQRRQAIQVSRDQSFKGRQFTAEVILWAQTGQGSACEAGQIPAEGVRWYLMFPISYRDLELMLLDRGVEVDHTTIFRWIQAYAVELEKRIRRFCQGSCQNHRSGQYADKWGGCTVTMCRA
jgi:transposase, IS6 family